MQEAPVRGFCCSQNGHGSRGGGAYPLWARVLRLIVDIAASSVARYGPVEVLRLPVGRPPDDETARPPAGKQST